MQCGKTALISRLALTHEFKLRVEEEEREKEMMMRTSSLAWPITLSHSTSANLASADLQIFWPLCTNLSSLFCFFSPLIRSKIVALASTTVVHWPAWTATTTTTTIGRRRGTSTSATIPLERGSWRVVLVVIHPLHPPLPLQKIPSPRWRAAEVAAAAATMEEVAIVPARTTRTMSPMILRAPEMEREAKVLSEVRVIPRRRPLPLLNHLLRRRPRLRRQQRPLPPPQRQLHQRPPLQLPRPPQLLLQFLAAAAVEDLLFHQAMMRTMMISLKAPVINLERSRQMTWKARVIVSFLS